MTQSLYSNPSVLSVKGDETMQKIIYKTKDDDYIAKENTKLLKTRSAASKILNIFKNE
jgi:hypothetical protein